VSVRGTQMVCATKFVANGKKDEFLLLLPTSTIGK
jgi:hypothetical protein